MKTVKAEGIIEVKFCCSLESHIIADGWRALERGCSSFSSQPCEETRFSLVVKLRADTIAPPHICTRCSCASQKCYCSHSSLALQSFPQWKDGCTGGMRGVHQTKQKPFAEQWQPLWTNKITASLLSFFLQFSRIFHSSNLIARWNKCAFKSLEEFIKHSKGLLAGREDDNWIRALCSVCAVQGLFFLRLSKIHWFLFLSCT